MSTATMDVNLLKEMLRGVVREVIQEELLKLKLSLLPLISDMEMEEINRDLGSPEKYEEEEFESLDL
ncbi:MAG: hypothetical protein KAT34_15645 [Candidatus Aminicenantes bacterium]|nr:hypothetical protein [Candidatus Aminicenantes bacterium]